MATTTETAEVTPSPRRHRAEWSAVGLLCGINLMNYLDKSIFGLVGAPLMKEFDLSAEAFGLINSGFFVLFAVATGALSWLGNRFSTRVLLTLALLIWSLLQFPVVAGGLGVIIVCRLLLGIAEGPSMPWSQVNLQQWYPDERRQAPTMFLYAFPAVAGIAAFPALGWVITAHGWRAAYLVLGVVGLVVAAVWAIAGREGPLATNRAELATPTVPQRRVLLSFTFLGAAGAMFMAQWFLSIGASWLPVYFEQGLGYTTQSASIILAGVLLVASVTMVLFGVLSQWLTRRGWRSRNARVHLVAGALAASAASLVTATVLPDGFVSLLFVGLGIAFGVCGFSLGPVLIGQIVPSRQRAGIFGFLFSVAALGSIVAPTVTGFLVGGADTERAGFHNAFLLSAAIGLAVAVLLALKVDPERDAAAAADAN